VTATGLDALIDPAATLTCLGTGFQFTEGPAWDSEDGRLVFSDIPGDTRWRWTASGGMQVVARPTFRANGLVFDADGALVVCEHVTSSVTRLHRDGSCDLVAFHYRGKYLNSPNDVVTRGSDGSIYFTDPDYGRWNDWIGQERSRDLGFRGLYRVPPGGGDLQLLVAEDEFDQPNGLCFSPDEALLYVNDSPQAHIKVFDVAPDGSIGGGRIFCDNVGKSLEELAGEETDEHERHRRLHESGALDGMKCDEHGNVWTTGPGGVWVIAPDGEQRGVLPAPEVVGNLVWGGDDLHTLFLMTSTTVHSIETRVAPAPLPCHR